MTLRTTATREANQVGAQAEASALASRQADRRRQEVEDGEHERRDDGHGDDLLETGYTAGDDNHRHRDGETLQKILNNAGSELNGRQVHFVSVHGE